jgi:hypothetical protein
MSSIPGPDPFIVEDPDTPATSTPLPIASPSFQSQQLNINKDVPLPPPPPPGDDDEDDDDEQPEIYLPQLVIPTMFLPLPNVSAAMMPYSCGLVH